jgi:hypothetical protein
MNSFKQYLFNKNRKKIRKIYKKEDNIYKIYRKQNHIYGALLLEETNDPKIDLNDPDFRDMIKVMIFLF